MKRFFLLSIILILAISQSIYAQTLNKNKQQDTIQGLITYKQAIKVEDAKAILTRETKLLEMPSDKSKISGKTIGDSVVSKAAIGGSAPQGLLQAPVSSAGPTVGQLDVSSTGAATYMVPITLPPGIGNMVPQIALTYNSQGGNGVVGLGWSISGLSAITRIPTTTFHDNKVGAVSFNSNDRFALDGQRLLLKSGTYGSDGAEYQTENYSNIKIISRGVSPFGVSYGPAYFEIFYPDGSKAVYGGTNGSRTTTSFALTYMENSLGARINYTYSISDNTFIVTEIAYGNLGANQTLNKVNFNYSEINRAEMGYTGGDRLYRKSLLNKISVTANGAGYRSYVLALENVPTLNYKRVTSITEYNGDQTLYRSPLYFSYHSTTNTIITSEIGNLSWTGLATNNSEVFTSDYTGDGKMDFILKPRWGNSRLTLFFDLEKRANESLNVGIEVNTGDYRNIFTGNILTANSKIMPQQGITLVRKGITSNSFKFDNYLFSAAAPMLFQYDKVWENAPTGPTYYSECEGQDQPGSPLQMNFFSGDFNGDGLMDVIAINYPEVITYQRWEWVEDPNTPQLSEYQCFTDYGQIMPSKVHFINLDRRVTTNFVTDLGVLLQKYYPGDGLYTYDFNGDGKTDFLHMKNGELFVYGLNDTNTALELLWQKSDAYINTSQQALFGDYNGDGKTDIMFTTGYNNNFAVFLSTGKDFTVQTQNYPFSNVKYDWNETYLQEGYLIPTDINNDGKTDIIEVYNYTQNNTGGWSTITIHHNMGTSPAYEQHFANGGSAYVWSGAHHPIPIFLNSDKQNPKLEFGLLSMNSIKLARFEKDFKSETQLSSVSQDGVTHHISYKSLGETEDNIIVGSGLSYESSYDQTYPNIDLHNLAGLNVVDKITRTYNNEQLQQVFGYSTGVSNMEGIGFLGFGKLVRSNWHTDDYDQNKLFNTTISDPQLRGAVTKTFTSKYPYISPSIAMSSVPDPDITLSGQVNGTQISEASNSITLLPGFEASGANGTYVARIMDPAMGINDGATIYNYITRTDYTYQTTLLPNKVFINTPISVSTKDLLNGTNTLQLNEYDNYYNITKTTTNLSGSGTKTEEITYDNNPAGYYIGRPLTRKTTNSISGDTHTTEEQYTYTGNLPTQVKRKGNGTAWLTENLTYDAFGNVTQKTIVTPNNGQRSTSSTYDPTGRFVSSVTDAEGLTTSYTNDPATGYVLTQTNPYGQITSFTYDIWGRSKEITDYAGKKSYTNYQTGPNGYIITETDDQGHEKVTYYNHLGQSTEVTEKTLTGSLVGAVTQYDVYGRAYRQSQPAAPGSYSQWNETAFDEYGRVKKTTAYTGKVTNYSYNGLSSTVNDGTKSITTTKNALGQAISLQDPGGTINYAYYAHGGLKNANYDGAVQSLVYDGWGRKTKLTDPSAGVYTYAYNDFGEITQETTPKGTTNYGYDATGKLATKTLTGDATNLAYAYSYNNTTKLLENLTFTNADGNNAGYTYTYDNNKRLVSTVEDNLHAIFTKTYTYDSFDRIATETYQAKDKASNTTASRTIAYTYQNGEVLQVTDQATGQILSKTQTLKANGLLATELQGANLKTTYNYDAFNLPQSTVTERTGSNPVTLMTLGYGFDAQRGNLNSRSNSALSWNESFSYDNSDRLIGFNDNNGSNTQAYDARGRITQNSQLGNYAYSGTGYQQTELNNPTPEAYNWYQSRSLQQISFNAFKQPVNINEQGVEQIDFQYNAALQRSHMYYGSTDADKMLRPMRRHYSEDGGMEITRNLTTGETSFVFYLSGDAYSAPAIYKEVHNNSGTSQDLYYLHRDHLGSIVLITDVNGSAVEKRQFDAWGNIVALTDGNGNPLTAFVILDRGYTGHEHLLGVGLIHMNGRLYDPKLHRFLSPDNFVQDASNTQNFNRYGYAMNNPLIYADPNGEFLFAFIAVGALIGALTGGVSYAASAIRTGDWSWKGLGMSMLTGAVIGGITGGVNPASLISGSLGNTFATAFVGGLMPSANFKIGNFGFSISPSLAFGQSFGIGANLGVSYTDGNFSVSAGIGIMRYGNYQGFGKSGMEIRSSLMAAYDNGTTGISLGTNFWRGTGAMNEFNQRTGVIGLHFGDFRAMYENDGSIGKLGDDGDRYRSAALNLSYKDYSVGFNLFTGYRDYDGENGSVTQHRNPMSVDEFGRRMPNGVVRELNTPYRLGLLTMGYKNTRMGVNSEHVRHAIQDQAIHNLKIPGIIDKRQMGFANQSWNWDGYAQYRTRNSFSSW